MKKYIAIALAALCAFSFTACEKFLDYAPQGSPTVDNYFLNDDQANNAVDIIYYRLFERDGMFSRDIYWEQACANDMVWGKTRGFNPLATLTYTGNESPLVDTFGRIYRYGLSRANWVVNALLQKQEKEGLSDVEHRVLGRSLQP